MKRGEDEDAVCSIRSGRYPREMSSFPCLPYVREVEIYSICSPRTGIFIMTRRLEVNIVFCCVSAIGAGGVSSPALGAEEKR
jgi:hypothetical protein